VIDLQYLSLAESFGRHRINVYEQKQVSLKVLKGRKYDMSYDVETHRFEWQIQ
jgi:hypothetical protein